MKKIVWIADVPGWAYDNRARRLIALMPQYAHEVVYNIVQDFSEALGIMAGADLIVCPDPRILCFVPGRENVIQHLNAVKIF